MQRRLDVEDAVSSRFIRSQPDLEGLYLALVKSASRKSSERKAHRILSDLRQRRPTVGHSSGQAIHWCQFQGRSLQLIGGQWRQMQKDRKAAEKEQQAAGPRTGDRRARSQRKSGQRSKVVNEAVSRSAVSRNSPNSIKTDQEIFSYMEPASLAIPAAVNGMKVLISAYEI